MRLATIAYAYVGSCLLFGCAQHNPSIRPSGVRDIDGSAVMPCRCPIVPLEQRAQEPGPDEVKSQLAAIRRELIDCFKADGIALIEAKFTGATGHFEYVEFFAGPDYDLKCVVRAFSRVCFLPFTQQRLNLNMRMPIARDTRPHLYHRSRPRCAIPPLPKEAPTKPSTDS